MNLRLILILGLALAGSYAAVYWKGSSSGGAKVEKAIEKKSKQIRKVHAKVKRESPGDSDKPAAIEFLRQRTRK